MTDYASIKTGRSLHEFYERGPSLWRWVKYGHGKSVPYVNPFSRESLTAPSAPFIEKRINFVMTRPHDLPSILQNRALRFHNIFKRNQANAGIHHEYPGDGYVFFMDRNFIENYYPRHVNPVTIHLYNYLYSYRHLMTPALFDHLSGLRGTSFREISIIPVLYEYRFRIFKDTSFFDTLNSYCKTKHHQEAFESVLISRLLGHAPKDIVEANEIVHLPLNSILTLLNAYTLESVKRILFNPNTTSQHIRNSVSLVTETISLIHHPLPHKFTSPFALRRFHNIEAMRILNIARAGDPNWSREYEWPSGLVDLIESISEGEWHIPVMPIELVIRGENHHNCIGSYIDDHFEKPAIDTSDLILYKTLILLSEEAEAELLLVFEKQDSTDKPTGAGASKTVCIHSRLVQCKTMYNKEYVSPIPERICAALIGREPAFFTPSLKADTPA